MTGRLIRIERMLSELKRYTEIPFENSQLVDCVVKSRVPATYLSKQPKNIGDIGRLNDTQRLAISMAMEVN